MKRRHITNPLFSLVEIKKKSQNNSPLHLPFNLHLKTPTPTIGREQGLVLRCVLCKEKLGRQFPAQGGGLNLLRKLHEKNGLRSLFLFMDSYKISWSTRTYLRAHCIFLSIVLGLNTYKYLFLFSNNSKDLIYIYV